MIVDFVAFAGTFEYADGGIKVGVDAFWDYDGKGVVCDGVDIVDINYL